uniref:Serpin domain-containing protein n=1 Tax=Aegilops tauschii TaxID=37682 RepID=R7W6M4_AEGTA
MEDHPGASVFECKRTAADAPFRRLGGAHPVDVPFMQSWDEQFVAVHDGFKVLKLRYKMADAFLTRDPKKPAPFFPQRAPLLRPDRFSNAASPSRHGSYGRAAVLPLHDSVVDVLKELGLSLPFSPLGDLSDMTGPDDSGFGMVVDEVVHKAVIEVNEEGTEAVAVTMVTDRYGCAARCSPPRRVDFVADHPFAYFIVEEETGAVVFAGHVVDPSKETCSLPIPSSSSSSQSSPPNGASRRSAQIGGGLRVVLLAGESLVLLAVGEV